MTELCQFFILNGDSYNKKHSFKSYSTIILGQAIKNRKTGYDMLKYQVQNQTLTAKPKLESRSVVGVQRFLHLCCAMSIMGCISQII